jgi:branched-chain amino acid transport system substrate-binding protein
MPLARLPLPLFATLALLLPAVPAAAGEPAPIKVGLFASLTGKEAAFGQATRKGVELAVEELNAAGGVLGRRFELVIEDNQSKAGESATIAKKLIARDKVVALIGEVASSRSLEAAPIAQQSRVPMISPSSTNPKVTEIGNYVFRVCFIDPFQGVVMAKFARQSLKLQRVALLTSVSSAYSVGLAKYFREHFTAAGGTVALEQKYSEGDKDFKAQLTAIKAGAPDAIFASGYYNEVALIAVQARELGITVPLLGGDGWDSPSLVEVGGKAMEGCFFSNHFSNEDTSPAIQSFVKAYEAKHGAKPDAMAALGYDSAKILFDAIKRAGTVEGKALRDAIAATKDFPGITGSITLDEKRNANKPAVILTIKDGKVVYTETIAP